MIWYKYVSPSGHFYSPFGRSKTTLEHHELTTDMVKSLNARNSRYEVHSDNLVEVYNKEIPESNPEDLPSGVYSHSPASSSTPESLTPMEIRVDNYMDLIGSLHELDENISHFKNNKELYDEAKTIYKMGILLFGPPGTGKSSFLREFIRTQENSVVIFLDTIPSRAFLEKLENSTKDKLKVIVFEEVVSLLEDSNDIRDMLDFLDGSTSLSNTIYFMSTNYPESIPENVIRNGRVDVFVRVGFPEATARGMLIKNYLNREATEEEIEVTANMPIVDIRETCFLHRKTGKSFKSCAKNAEDKHKMLKKHFGKAISLKATSSDPW